MGKQHVETINFSDVDSKRRHIQQIWTLQGLYDVTLKPRKRTRTLDQNSYYWVAICAPLGHWLTEQSGEPFTKDDAHEYLKSRFTPVREPVIKSTGEVMEIRRSTSDLDTLEFSDYVERCIDWMAEFCEINVLPSNLFHEQRAS
jgi:hypothetical protein